MIAKEDMKVGKEVWLFSFRYGAWSEYTILKTRIVSFDDEAVCIHGTLPRHNATDVKVHYGIQFVDNVPVKDHSTIGEHKELSC